MKLPFIALSLPLCGFSCAPLPPATQTKPHVDPGRYVKTIPEGDLNRSYILRVPKGYDNKSNYPVVVFLHGWGSTARQMENASGFGAEADKAGFILAVPDGTPGIGSLQGWNTGFLNVGVPKADDVRLVGDILDQIEKDLHVDTNRVYVAGHSNGAMMAYDVAANLSDRIAAIAVVSGSVGLPKTRVSPPKSPVSAIIFHGKADTVVPYDGLSTGLIQCVSAPDSAKWWAEKDNCGPLAETKKDDLIIDDYPGKNGTEVELVTIVGGEHSWPVQVGRTGLSPADMIWDFFKSHPKRP